MKCLVFVALTRPWLSDTTIPVSVNTDHKNLEYFMVQRQLNHQARWMLDARPHGIQWPMHHFYCFWVPNSYIIVAPVVQRSTTAAANKLC